MKFQEIVEAKKKFADIPCPGCGDPKCDHKEDHMKEGTRCWKGYKKKGMKTMFGKRVPNCVKEVNTGNPHKGKYVIKTDEPGRKSPDIVIMPDQKAADDMVSSLSKKKPNLNYWAELVEDPNYKTKAAMEKFVNSGGKIGDVNDWDNPTNDELEKERRGADQFVQDRKEQEMAKELELYIKSQKRYNYETTKRNFYAKYGLEKAERMLAAMKDKGLFI